MKKSNLITLLISTIVTLFLMADFALSQTYNNTLEAADGTPDDAVYVDNDGNVGIGTNAPSTELDVWDGRVSIKSPYDGAYLRFRYKSYDTYSEIGMTQWSGSSGLWIGSNLNSLSAAHMSPTQSNSSFSSWYAFLNSNGDYFRINRIGPGSGTTNSTYFNISGNGNVGILTTNPQARLSINSTQNSDIMDFMSGNHLRFRLRIQGTGTDGLYLEDESDNNLLSILETGNVGIGTTSPQSELAVNGKITAEEVEVISNVAANEFTVRNSQWSDFVFEKDYNLPSLKQVESYIKENKHLPDIPSAKQVEEEGLSMVKMMKKQMQKIEELTLYVIELKKENETIKKELTKMQKNMN